MNIHQDTAHSPGAHVKEASAWHYELTGVDLRNQDPPTGVSEGISHSMPWTHTEDTLIISNSKPRELHIKTPENLGGRSQKYKNADYLLIWSFIYYLFNYLFTF